MRTNKLKAGSIITDRCLDISYKIEKIANCVYYVRFGNKDRTKVAEESFSVGAEFFLPINRNYRRFKVVY